MNWIFSTLSLPKSWMPLVSHLQFSGLWLFLSAVLVPTFPPECPPEWDVWRPGSARPAASPLVSHHCTGWAGGMPGQCCLFYEQIWQRSSKALLGGHLWRKSNLCKNGNSEISELHEDKYRGFRFQSYEVTAVAKPTISHQKLFSCEPTGGSYCEEVLENAMCLSQSLWSWHYSSSCLPYSASGLN